ncbi:MAG: hypothetical protein JJU03_11950 [Idiomarina sp.]|nr:hypothetical protein [Idiomarina sp.]
MQPQHLTHSLLVTGTERLSLLGKHADVLMRTYICGELDESQVSERGLKKLVNAHILYQPDETRGFILRPQCSDLIASMVADEHRRHINADVADKLETMRMRVQNYRDAQRCGDTIKAESELQHLTNQVHDLAGQFGEAIDSLWHRLNSNFGFVSSLADKIRENDRAQKQIKRLLDGLNLIDFAELIELGEGNVHLRKLLVSQLQRQLSGHHTSLLEVQVRLAQLMLRFREQQARSVLIANMAGFLREHPGFVVGSYTDRSTVPDLFNQAKPIVPAAALSLDSHSAQQCAAEIARSLPMPERQQDSADGERAQVASGADSSEVEARQQALKTDVETFMLEVVDTGRASSALDYLEAKGFPWDAEVWLFQVLSEYQGLQHEQRALFRLQRSEAAASRYNDLYIISDLELSFVQAA